VAAAVAELVELWEQKKAVERSGGGNTSGGSGQVPTRAREEEGLQREAERMAERMAAKAAQYEEELERVVAATQVEQADHAKALAANKAALARKEEEHTAALAALQQVT
jgi:hypothetical protein